MVGVAISYNTLGGLHNALNHPDSAIYYYKKAIDLYNSYPDRGLKFGISDAQTYYWLHAMNAVEVRYSQSLVYVTTKHYFTSSGFTLACVFQKMLSGRG